MSEERSASYRPGPRERGLTSATPRAGQGLTSRGLPVPHQEDQAAQRAEEHYQQSGTGELNLWTSRIDRHWVPGNGWQIVEEGLLIDSVGQLGRELRSRRYNGRVARLAICAHSLTSNGIALPGTVDLDPPLTADSIRRRGIARAINRLRWFLRRDAIVIFYSCIAGAGLEGNELLNGLSRLLPGRTVVGFITYGFIGPSSLPETAGNVTDTLLTAYPSGGFRGYPRMHQTRPSAKHARNGRIVVWPRPRVLWEEMQRFNPGLANEIAADAFRPASAPTSAALAGQAMLTPFEYFTQRRLNVGG